MLKIDKKKLATDIAKLRGYSFCEHCGNSKVNDTDMESFIFHDSQFLPMLRELRKNGWEIILEGDIFSVYYYGDRKSFPVPEFSIIRYGEMIACCLAYRIAMTVVPRRY